MVRLGSRFECAGSNASFSAGDIVKSALVRSCDLLAALNRVLFYISLLRYNTVRQPSFYSGPDGGERTCRGPGPSSRRQDYGRTGHLESLEI